MRKTLPDEHGWYWAKSPRDGEWCMAFVNMNRETITLFDGVDPRNDQIEYPMDEFKNSDRHWYGPFNCPGTDFGQHTIVIEEEQHQKAERDGEAIVVTYADFRHCDDLHSSIAIVGRCSEEQARAITQRETRELGIESKLVKLCRELDMELDGVRLPAPAAAVANGIRSTLERLEDD